MITDMSQIPTTFYSAQTVLEEYEFKLIAYYITTCLSVRQRIIYTEKDCMKTISTFMSRRIVQKPHFTEKKKCSKYIRTFPSNFSGKKKWTFGSASSNAVSV